MTVPLKKLTLILLSLAMLTGAVTGCSGRTEPAAPAEEETPAGESAGDTGADEQPATGGGSVSGAGSGKPAELLQFQEVKAGDTLVTLVTTLGEVKIKLFPEKAPKTVANFIGLAEQGYYTGKIFHRIIPDFMAQGGSPNGDGLGGESIYKDDAGNSLAFEDEFSMDLWHFKGALSMANSGANTNLSQFFIVEGYEISDDLLAQMKQAQFPAAVIEKYQELGGTPHLDWQHTVFGQVVEGMDVVAAMMAAKTGEGDKPVEDIIILSVKVETAE